MSAPRTYTADELEAMSPGQRQEAILEMQTNGIDTSGIPGIARYMVASAQAGQRAEELNDRQVRELSSGDVEYVEGLSPSNSNYQGHAHSDMQRYVTVDMDPDDAGQISDAYHQLHQEFQTFSETLSKAVAKSQSEWEGDAATSAHGYFQSLSTWADGNSQNAKLASEVMYQQSTSASTAKNSMPEEIPFDWSTEMTKWASAGPLGAPAAMAQSVETYQQSQAAHDEAARVMTQYDNDLYGAASKQPAFAEPPKFGAGGADAGRMGTPPNIATPPGGSTDPSGYNGGTPGAGNPPSPGGGPISPIPTPGTGGPSPSPAPTPTPTPAPGIRTGTNPAGYQPNTPPARMPTTGVPSSNSNFSNMNGMPMAAPMGGGGQGFGPGGDTARGGSGFGRGVGGFGPGGSGGAGAGAAPGAGAAARGAVPGAMGGGAGGAAAGAAGAAGAGGRGGAGMAGGMGGAGRGGQGGEDDEHTRATYLVEADPDAVFGTDQRTAPPVIGE